MRKSTCTAYCLLAGMTLASSAAIAELPPLSAEEQAVAARKKAMEKKQLEKSKLELERVQDRIGRRYGNGARQAVGKTQDENMPKITKERRWDASQTQQQHQTGEDHSAPAR